MSDLLVNVRTLEQIMLSDERGVGDRIVIAGAEFVRATPAVVGRITAAMSRMAADVKRGVVEQAAFAPLQQAARQVHDAVAGRYGEDVVKNAIRAEQTKGN